MSADFRTRQLRVSQIVNSGSTSTTPLLIYGLGSATDDSGGFTASHFSATGSDTWLFISGTSGAKGSASRGVVTFKGDVVISGTIYNGAGAAYSTSGGGGTPGGSNTQIQFNSGSIFSGSQYFTFNYTSSSLQNGFAVVASGLYSHAQGFESTSSALSSHAEGLGTRATNTGAHSEGHFTLASGYAAHSEGYLTTASLDYSHAEGYQTRASGVSSHAEGRSTNSSGQYSHAEGQDTESKGFYSHAEGQNTIASGSYSHAEGFSSVSSGSYSHAEGQSTIASGSYSHAEGAGSRAVGDWSHAEGNNSVTSGSYSHAEGQNTVASGIASHAEGAGSRALGDRSHAEGYQTTGSGDWSHAEGYESKALGSASHSEGLRSVASGSYSHAEGHLSITSGSYSHAEGYQTVARGNYSHTEGAETIATGSYSHAEGYQTIASGSYSHAEGSQTIASGSYSHAEGRSTIASGSYSHAEGFESISSGQYSHAEGYGVTSSGQYSHAEGVGTTSSGAGSHAEGIGTTSSGGWSHAEGNGAASSGDYSHAEGQNTTSSGQYSHAEGNQTVASGQYSHAEGNQTVASGQYSHAEGGSGGGGATLTAAGNYSHAEGYNTVALGSYTHTEGFGSKAGNVGFESSDAGSSTPGTIIVNSSYGNISSLFGSFIIFDDSEYSGVYNYTTFLVSSVSWNGTNTVITLIDNTVSTPTGAVIGNGESQPAGADYSLANVAGQHAEGYDTNASGDYAHAEGYETVAAGAYSHAEGFQTIAAGIGSKASGYQAKAYGQYSSVNGQGTIASGSYQYVVGKYNVRSNPGSLFVVGDGSGDSNAQRRDVLRVNSGSVQVTGSLIASRITGSIRKTAGDVDFITGSGVTVNYNSSGQWELTASGGGGTPAGSNTQVQFNADGAFAATSGLTFATGSSSLTISGDLAVNGGDITTSASTFNIASSATTLNLGSSAGKVVVPGDFEVQGTTVTVDVTNITIEDPLISLGFTTGSVAGSAGDRGFIGGITGAGNNVAFAWSNNSGSFVATKTTSTPGATSVVVGALQPIRASSFQVNGTTAVVTSSNGTTLTLSGTAVVADASTAGKVIFKENGTNYIEFATSGGMSAQIRGIESLYPSLYLSGAQVHVDSYDGNTWLDKNSNGFLLVDGTSASSPKIYARRGDGLAYDLTLSGADLFLGSNNGRISSFRGTTEYLRSSYNGASDVVFSAQAFNFSVGSAGTTQLSGSTVNLNHGAGAINLQRHDTPFLTISSGSGDLASIVASVGKQFQVGGTGLTKLSGSLLALSAGTTGIGFEVSNTNFLTVLAQSANTVLSASNQLILRPTSGITQVTGTLAITSNVTASNLRLSGDIQLEGGDIQSTAGAVSLFTDTGYVTTVNIGGFSNRNMNLMSEADVSSVTFSLARYRAGKVDVYLATGPTDAEIKNIDIGTGALASGVTYINLGSATANSYGRTLINTTLTDLKGLLTVTGSTGFGISSSNQHRFKGSVIVSGSITGSLTKLFDGTDYLRAGSNVTLATGSSGQVTISSALNSAIGASGSIQWNDGSGALLGGNYLTWNDGQKSLAHGNIEASSAFGEYSHAEGDLSFAWGKASHAEGTQTQAGIEFFLAESMITGTVKLPSSYGDQTLVFDSGQILLVGDGFYFEDTCVASFDGTNTYIACNVSRTITAPLYVVDPLNPQSGNIAVEGSHSEGYNTRARGNYSHAEGFGTIAAGSGSHAEGYSSISIGRYSHSEGVSSTSIGSGSHSEGFNTIASGSYSHAGGIYTIASGSGQTVYGKYNKRGNDFSLFVVGDGTGDSDANRGDILRINSGSAIGSGNVQVTGSLIASNITGSLTKLTNGSNYLRAGSNVTLTTGSDGSVTIASTGGSGSPAGSNTQVQFNANGAFAATSGLTFATGSSSLTISGDLAVNGGDITTTESSATIFSTNVSTLSLASAASSVSVGGSSSSTAFTLNVAANRTGNSTLNLGAGATSTGNTKSVNIGQGGDPGSTTNIRLGTTDTNAATNIYMSGSVYVTGSVGMKGSIIPDATSTYTLGTDALRWAHVYTGDLHLRNERGDWTVIEEHDFLRIVNNKTGKNFKMLMQPLD